MTTKKLFNMTKENAINELKKVNSDIKMTANKVKVKDIEKEASKEQLHPQGYRVNDGLLDTFKAMVNAYGYKVAVRKNGGVVAKNGRKKVFELYDVTGYDKRIHLYCEKDILDTIIKGKYKGFLTTNDKWSIGNRFEFTQSSWLQFVNNYFEIKR